MWNNITWQMAKVYHKIWLGFVDYGRVAWEKTDKKKYASVQSRMMVKRKFKVRWCKHEIFACMIDSRPRWRLFGPNTNFNPTNF